MEPQLIKETIQAFNKVITSLADYNDYAKQVSNRGPSDLYGFITSAVKQITDTVYKDLDLIYGNINKYIEAYKASYGIYRDAKNDRLQRAIKSTHFVASFIETFREDVNNSDIR